MIAYKFLRFGGVGLFSGFRWPLPAADSPGSWVVVRGRLRESLNGLHGCRAAGLPAWLDDELWTLELSGAILERQTTVVGRRGRLLERVSAWAAPAADEFAEACVLRARDRAVEALRPAGREREADELSRAGTLPALTKVAGGHAGRLEATEPAAAGVLAFVADTAVLACGRRPDAWRASASVEAKRPRAAAIAANLGFVVAHGAGLDAARRGGAYEAGVAEERAWQAQWLTERLALPSP